MAHVHRTICPPNRTCCSGNKGFTLIELSIVLVIIGLIIGGVLVGQDLIGAAGIRAQIAQIEKYNTATNTFRNKYNALPGDMTGTQAAMFGFVTRAGTQGRGDGDGLLEGYDYGGSTGAYTCSNANQCYLSGEPSFFWEDLALAKLIDGGFNRVPDSTDNTYCNGCGNNDLSLVFPRAKLGNGNYIYVYASPQQNYFGILGIGVYQYFVTIASPSLTVAQAYNIDKKIDDGLPLSGKVTDYAYTMVVGRCRGNRFRCLGWWQSRMAWRRRRSGHCDACLDNQLL